MFEYIKGIIDSVQANGVVIEAGGIGYYVYMANPYRFTSDLKQVATIWLYQSVSENDMRLYGFKTKEEKALFLQLISVSGIGPKSALSILSLGDNEGFIRAIQNEELTFLTKFPGVGKKTAQRIVLDLKDKVDLLDVSVTNTPQPSMDQEAKADAVYLEEMEAALTSLGYTNREISRVLKKADFSDVETTAEAIRVALRFITKG